MATATTNSERIKELVTVQPSEEFRISEHKEDDWVVPGLLILRGESRNGRRYTQQARDDAAKLCEGLALSSEHEDETRIQNGNPGRFWHERLGALENGRVDKNGDVRADARLCESHPHARLFRDNCRKFPKNACLSVELDRDSYESSHSEDGKVQVSRIYEMLDVSVVARGGTTRSLFESDQSKMKLESHLKESTMADDVTKVVDEKIREQEERRRITEQIATLKSDLSAEKTKNGVLEERIAEFEKKEARIKLVAKIKEEAKALNCDIDDGDADDLSHLPAERITEQLKKRAELISKAGGSSSTDRAPNLYAPSSHGNPSSEPGLEADKATAWMSGFARG